MSGISISLPKGKQERLTRLALRFGLSLPEFSRRILEEVSSDIQEESLSEYENPKELKTSFNRALRDWQTGRVHTAL